MAGTMSKKELHLSCKTTNNAMVSNVLDNTNAAGITIVDDTMYIVKAHKNVDGEVVYKSIILKSSSFDSCTVGTSNKFKEIKYYAYGITSTDDSLVITCKKSKSEPGVLEISLDDKTQKFTKLDKTYIGITKYRSDEFILMEPINSEYPSTLKFVRGTIEDISLGKGESFTIEMNDYSEYKKSNDIYYDDSYGLFITLNHYVTDYSKCKNRILLVKPEDYKAENTYYPYTVFQSDMDTSLYKQYNFEGIVLYNKNMWTFANVVDINGKSKDTIGHQAGVKFENGFFTFNASVKDSVLLPNKYVDDTLCKNVQSTCIDKDDISYYLKCDSSNTNATMYKVDSEFKRVSLNKSYDSTESLYHCNGMCYNYDDDKIYVTGYTIGSPVTSDIKRLAKDGNIECIYKLDKAQYGIAYYEKKDDNFEFILMNKGSKPYVRVSFNRAIINGDNISIDDNKFYIDGIKEENDTLQDIFYHKDYGMFIPVCIYNYDAKCIIYHISKEDINKVMNGGTDRVLYPDFSFIIDKSKSGYTFYEIESLDIHKDYNKMILCGNMNTTNSSKKKIEKDNVQILNTIKFI